MTDVPHVERGEREACVREAVGNLLKGVELDMLRLVKHQLLEFGAADRRLSLRLLVGPFQSSLANSGRLDEAEESERPA